MDHYPLTSPHLLVVEPDRSLGDLLTEFLSEVGYVISRVSSLKEAQRALREETFALVLAHLFVGRSLAGSFTPAHQLRRMAHPTPVGLLITIPISLEEAQRAGFVFALPMPFDLEDLLAEVAQAIQQPLSAEDEQRISLVERCFAAQEEEDWLTVLDLCTEDIRVHPSSIPATGRMSGQVEALAHLKSTAQVECSRSFLHRYYATLPKGTVVRYLGLWTTPEGERRREARVAYFHFRGEKIYQVGIRRVGSGIQELEELG